MNLRGVNMIRVYTACLYALIKVLFLLKKWLLMELMLKSRII